MQKFIHYAPRVLSVIIVAFLAMFILEGLGPDFGWQDSLMHGLLTLVVLGVTIIAWKWPKIGGWVFIILGIAYLFMLSGRHLWNLFIIGGVPLLTGILFLIDGFGSAARNLKNL